MQTAAGRGAIAALFIFAAGARLDAQEAPSLMVPGVVLVSMGPASVEPVEVDPALYLSLPPSFRIDWELPAPEPLAVEPAFPALAGLLRSGACDINYSADLVASAHEAADRSAVITAGNSICSLPQSIIGYCLSFCGAIFPSSGTYSLRQEDAAGVTGRIFAFRDEAPMREPFVEGINRLAQKEQSYFASFSENPMFTFSVEQGYSEVDMRQFREDQRKIFLDVMRKTYLSKYFSKVEDRVRDDAWRFQEWRGVDFIIGPPLIAAYTYLRGIDRKVTIAGDLKFRIAIEPLRRIEEYRNEDERDLVGALTMELGFSSFPIKAVASWGYHNGEAELDFVGIGTSVGEAKKVVAMTLAVEEPESLDR